MTGIGVHVIPTEAPDDTAGLETRFETGAIDPDAVIAVLGKTEGNGCVNDFSRGLATMAYEHALATARGVAVERVREEVTLMMSGGTEGVMTPHVTVFTREPTAPRSAAASDGREKRLAAGTAETATIDPEAIGRNPQITATATAVRRAIDDAELAGPEAVRFVQIKCPLLTNEAIADARDRGETVAVENTYESMAYSRGASALGVAVALEEMAPAAIDEEAICEDSGCYSQAASTSAGVELDHSEVLVLGNSAASTSDLVVGSAVMDDALDAAAVRAALADAGIEAADGPGPADAVRNVFAKAEASHDGRIRGRRHVIHNDSDIEPTRHARAVVSAVIGAVTGDPLAYVSGGAEHQGPDGGGPVAVIAEAAGDEDR